MPRRTNKFWGAPRGKDFWFPRLIGAVVALPFLVFLGPSVLNIASSFAPDTVLLKDFRQEYFLARAVSDGMDPYLPIRELMVRYLGSSTPIDPSFPTPHPPPVGVLFLPVALMEFEPAARTWLGIELVSLVLGVAFSICGAGLPVKLRLVPMICLLLIGWAPVSTDLVLGQVTIPMFALLAAAQLCFLAGRRRLGGGLLGVALLIKPLAWPWLLVLAARRMWSAVAATIAALLIGYVVAITRIGIAPTARYFTDVLPTVSNTFATQMTNVSLATLGPRLFRGVTDGDLAVTPPLIASPVLASVIGAALPIAVIVLAVSWLRQKPPLLTALAVMTCVSVLVNPISWQYNVTLAVLPAVCLVKYLYGLGFQWPNTVLSLLIALALFVPDAIWSGLGRTVGEVGALATVEGLVTLGPALATGALALVLVKFAREKSQVGLLPREP